MKSSKSLYSQCFSEYKLDEETIKKLQDVILEIFLDVKSICDKYNIDYMLACGSCLGAIRHKGFIPWDDDIDIMMKRTEYEKFAEKFVKEFSDKYILAEPLKQENYFSKMPKIYKKGTKYIEITNAGINGLDMIFIDIFIIENMPTSKIKRKIIGSIYNLAYKGASGCIDYLYPSPIIEEKAKENKELKKYYNFRKMIGWIFSHIGGIKFWLKFCDRLARKYKNSHILGIPSDFSYEKEIYERYMYDEITTGKFCGYDVKIPANYDTYLKNLYGDYMKIPSKEKREAHIAYKIEF